MLETYLVRGEADLVVHSNLENRVCVLQFHDGWATKVSVSVVAVSEGEAVDTSVALVVCRSIVQESANTSTLEIIQPNSCFIASISSLPCRHGYQ